MKIKMLSTQKGSINGIQVATYEAESVHDLSASKGERELAAVFVREGWAIESPPVPATPAQEQPAKAGFFTPVDEAKAIEAAPENKMMKRPYTRKAK